MVIERKNTIKLLNRWSRMIMQHTEANADPLARFDESKIISKKYNLDGTGEIIGSMDSGINLNSCFFYDSAYAQSHNNNLAPFTDIRSNPLITPYAPDDDDYSHRKIVQYVITGDKTDTAFGHGTHSTGSLAGQSAVLDNGAIEHSLLNGIAYGAKLAFFDMGDSSSNLHPPDNMEENIFPWAYKAGARIHSNSWGSNDIDNTYTYDSIQVDNYIYNNPDFLILFASGNDGANGYHTVSAPSTAKNALIVGATLAANMGFEESFCSEFSPTFPYLHLNDATCSLYSDSSTYNSPNLAYFSSMGPTSDSRFKPDIVSPGDYIVSAASPSSNSNNCNSPTTNVVKTMSGTSMATPITSGHVAIIRQYLREGWYPYGSFNSSKSILPSAALLKCLMIHGADIITGNQDIGCCIDNKNPYLGNCCNGGSGGRSEKFRTLTSISPQIEQGYGRLQLAKSIFLISNDNSSFSVPIYIMGHVSNKHISNLSWAWFPLIYNSEVNPFNYYNLQNSALEDPLFYFTAGLVHEYAVCTSNFKKNVTYYNTPAKTPFIRATLVWTDYPGSAASSHALVNDLDLSIVKFTSRFDTSNYFYGNGGSSADRNNNNEQINIGLSNSEFTPNSLYLIRVQGHSIPQGPQAYSLVVSGSIYLALQVNTDGVISYSCNSGLNLVEIFPNPDSYLNFASPPIVETISASSTATFFNGSSTSFTGSFNSASGSNTVGDLSSSSGSSITSTGGSFPLSYNDSVSATIDVPPIPSENSGTSTGSFSPSITPTSEVPTEAPTIHPTHVPLYFIFSVLNPVTEFTLVGNPLDIFLNYTSNAFVNFSALNCNFGVCSLKESHLNVVAIGISLESTSQISLICFVLELNSSIHCIWDVPSVMKAGTYKLRFSVTLPLLFISDTLNSTWYLSFSDYSSVFRLYLPENSTDNSYLIFVVCFTLLFVSLIGLYFYFNRNANSVESSIFPQNFNFNINSMQGEYQTTSTIDIESAFKINDDEDILVDDFTPINNNKISQADLEIGDGI